MLPRLLKLTLHRLRRALLALLAQAFGESEQRATVARPSQNLITKYFFRSRVLAVLKQRASEHFAYGHVPVGWFGIIGGIFSGDRLRQEIDARLFVATSQRDLSFQCQFSNLHYVGSRIIEETFLCQRLVDSTQCR